MAPVLTTISAAEIREMPREYRRTFVNCLSGFKGIHLCGTIDPTGRQNLSILSNVVHVGANPPLLGVLFRPDVVPLDTFDNIMQTGAFTLNHVQEAFLQAAHQTSARYPTGVSEFEQVGLTPLPTTWHGAPYVQEAELRIGLKFRERHRILANSTTFIVGEVMEIQVNAEAIGPDGFLDLAALGSVSSVGLDSYYRSGEIGRLPYARAPKSAE